MMSILGRRHSETWPGFQDVLAIALLAAVFVALVAAVRPLHLRDVADSLDVAREQARARFAAADRALGEQRDTAERMRADLARRETELGELRGARERLERELGAAVAQRQQSAAGLAAVQRELGQAQTALAEAQRELNPLRTALAEAQREAAAARGRAERLDGEVAAVRAQIDSQGQQSGATRESLRLAQEEVERLNRRAADAERERADTQRTTQEVTREVRELSAELDRVVGEARADSDRLRARLIEREEALRRQVETVAAREPIFAALTRDLAASRAEVARLIAVLQESEARLRRVETEASTPRAQEAPQPAVVPSAGIGADAMARLGAALAGQRGVRVEGSRVILGAEVLFPVGQFELQPAGREALVPVADAIRAAAPQIPAGVAWIVQVEGHTDRQPSRQRTNMELSQLRAMSVARFLAERGVPWERLSPAGFGEFHPIDQGDSDQAHARNRRIELRFTTR